MKSALRRVILRTMLVASVPLLAIPACSSLPSVAGSSEVQPNTCHASQLAFRLDGRDGEFNGMSHSGTMLILRNTGTAACTIPPQPVADLTDANRQALDIVAQVPSGKHPPPALPPLMVAPGASVESGMRWVSGNVYDDGHCESPAFITMAIGKETISAVFTGHLCGAAGKSSTYTLAPFRSAAPPAPAAAAKTLAYTCDDGRIVQAVYPDTHTAVLTLDQQAHRLEIAISADGARYVGDHWQWWTKGMHQASLTALKPGEEYASGSGADCHAP